MHFSCAMNKMKSLWCSLNVQLGSLSELWLLDCLLSRQWVGFFCVKFDLWSRMFRVRNFSHDLVLFCCLAPNFSK